MGRERNVNRPTAIVLSLLALVAIFLGAFGCDNGPGPTPPKANDPPSKPKAEALEGSYIGQRVTANLDPSAAPGVSMEHYTFRSNGTVELRHGRGSGTPDLRGNYEQSGPDRWAISWNSGKRSIAVRTSAGLEVDDLKVTPASS